MYFEKTNVMWIGKFAYESNCHISKHSHDFYHIFYIAGGHGDAVVDNRLFEVEKDWIIMCPPGCDHELTSSENSPLKTIEIKFEVNDEQMCRELNLLERVFEIASNDIRINFENAVDDIVKQDFMYKEFLKLRVCVILLTLIKTKKMDAEHTDSTIPAPLIKDMECEDFNFKKILTYINEHLFSPISLDDLSEQVQFNPSYLCRIFKNHFGIPPIQYINNMRLNKAKELIMYSDLNITQIAQAVGFESIHYFSRYFKKKEGVTPLEYKSRVRNSIYMSIL